MFVVKRFLSALLLGFAFVSVNTADSVAQSIDPRFFPPNSPQLRMCELLQDSGVYIGNPVLDCDDASWLMCLQFGGENCWQFGAYGPGPARQNSTEHDFSHAMIIIRDPNDPNRFCAFEPYGCETVHCWSAPSGNPSDDYPADAIRDALCQLRIWRDVLDCSRGPVTIGTPRPGHILDPEWGGEPGWWQCGSFKYTQRVCYSFRTPEGEVNVKCLPADIERNLSACFDLVDPDSPNSFCMPGSSRLCRLESGDLTALGCCAGDGRLPQWCFSPDYRDYPLCSNLEGEACNPDEGGFRDCVQAYPLGPISPSRGSWIVPTTTLKCKKCISDDFIGPPAPTTPDYCWVSYAGGLANSTQRNTNGEKAED